MSKKIVVITIMVLMVMGTLGVVVVWAGDLAAGPLVQVSGESPFDNDCGNSPGNVGTPGNVFIDSEVEPWVEVNPTNPNNIVGGWQQDRWSNGGARGNVAGVSLDGGESWQMVEIPGITECSDGDFQRASDPWVTFAPNGDVYFMSLVFDIDTPPGRSGGNGPNGMSVNKSSDGGLTWSAPVLLIYDDNPRFLNDKNSITADPTDADYVYAVWDRLQLPQGTVVNPERVFGFGFKGPVYIARTTDGGESWEPARKIYDPGANNQTIGNQIVVLPDGTVLDFFNEILNFKNSDGGFQFDFNLAFIRSEDQGETWRPKGKSIRVAKMQPRYLVVPGCCGVLDPETGAPVRTADLIPDLAVDPNNGNLYAVWQDASFSGFQHDSIAFIMSEDGGDSWSDPIPINKTPDNDNPDNEQAFTPVVHVLADGTVGVTYYDFRNNTSDPDTLLTDYFLAHCHEDCDDPDNWTETQLTDASFDMSQAPVARGYFTGDYEGLSADGANFAAFVSMPHDDDPASIFFRRVGPQESQTSQ